MSSDTIKDLFIELCKRGCTIIAIFNHDINHLPVCLVSTDDNMFNADNWYPIQFRIQSINSNSVYIDFKKCRFDGLYGNGFLDKYCIGFYNGENYQNVYSLKERSHNKNMKQLDLFANYLHTNGEYSLDYWCGNFYPKPDKELVDTKTLLKTKMIDQLISVGILEYTRAFNSISLISEIQSLILNIILELDNWHNLGFFIKTLI